ncbi:hypothetical protein BCR41DRAFT_373186 [Lobosporangium transversale]|uniref:BTB domain-containing protein n=1 Tax=Lobosporangium transversale TaxID=64571 RepID=A0A1Y2GFX4_9FUNG|nr:hypothetical protein BCR41DRAFT_373186 [Lobosporangium transversale]ORZ08481.1 hypothetical protein BCR41DRAFT_373186 [Lobosporangium transversale]|eukprot:XP_021878409.1 hypothetical protein BCR41DRAFT_373186 [Lobosporangium transversale]
MPSTPTFTAFNSTAYDTPRNPLSAAARSSSVPTTPGQVHIHHSVPPNSISSNRSSATGLSVAAPEKETYTLSDRTSILVQTTGQVPPSLIGSASVIYNGHMYLFGGRPIGKDPTNDLYVLNLDTLVWTLMDQQRQQSLHRQRMIDRSDDSEGDDQQQSPPSEDRMQTPHVQLSEDPSPELNTIDSSSSIPSPRYCHSAVLVVAPPLLDINGSLIGWGGEDTAHMIIFGGRCLSKNSDETKDNAINDSETCLNDTHILDLNTLQWIPSSLSSGFNSPSSTNLAISTDTEESQRQKQSRENSRRGSMDQLSFVSDDVFSESFIHLRSQEDQSPTNRSRQHDPYRHYTPAARFAHVASLTGDRMVIVGGRGSNNEQLQDICVLDLKTHIWMAGGEFQGQPSYGRSALASVEERPMTRRRRRYLECLAAESMSLQSRPSSTVSSSSSLTHQSLSASGPSPYGQLSTTPVSPSAMLNPLLNPRKNSWHRGEALDLGSGMLGGPDGLVPPKMLFPVAQIVDHYFLLSGASIEEDGHTKSQEQASSSAPTSNVSGRHFTGSSTSLPSSSRRHTFSVWMHHFHNHQWTQLELSKNLRTGEWSHSVLDRQNNYLYIFGRRTSDSNEEESYIKAPRVDDTDPETDFSSSATVASYSHLIKVDLEGLEICPDVDESSIGPSGVKMGLEMLRDGVGADVVLVSSADGGRVRVNSGIVGQRWGYFQALMEERERIWKMEVNERLAKKASEAADPPGDQDNLTSKQWYLDDRPAEILVRESTPLLVGFLQYLYTNELSTPHQLKLKTLQGLLLIAHFYDLTRLQQLVRQALYQQLNANNAPAICEIAVLTHEFGLQTRALRTILQSARLVQLRRQGEAAEAKRRLDFAMSRLEEIEEDRKRKASMHASQLLLQQSQAMHHHGSNNPSSMTGGSSISMLRGGSAVSSAAGSGTSTPGLSTIGRFFRHREESSESIGPVFSLHLSIIVIMQP